MKTPSKIKYRGRWLGVHSRHWPAIYRMSNHLPKCFEGNAMYAVPGAHQHLSVEELREKVLADVRNDLPNPEHRGSFRTRGGPTQ